MEMQHTAISSGTGVWMLSIDPVDLSDEISGADNNEAIATKPGILESNFNKVVLVAAAAAADRMRNVTENSTSSEANPPIKKTRPNASSLYR